MRTAVFGVAAVLVVASAIATHAQATDPFEFYKNYLAVLANANTLDVLLPYYTKELSGGLSKMPKDMQANYVKMNKRVPLDIKVTKQTVNTENARFEMMAKDADGQRMTGAVTLVKEAGAWKIDDAMWIGPPPKG
jgi:hypothetical protein